MINASVAWAATGWVVGAVWVVNDGTSCNDYCAT
jgi:hypothetical protein